MMKRANTGVPHTHHNWFSQTFILMSPNLKPNTDITKNRRGWPWDLPKSAWVALGSPKNRRGWLWDLPKIGVGGSGFSWNQRWSDPEPHWFPVFKNFPQNRSKSRIWMGPTPILIRDLVWKNRRWWVPDPHRLLLPRDRVGEIGFFEKVQNRYNESMVPKIGVGGYLTHTDFLARGPWSKSAWVPLKYEVSDQKSIEIIILVPDQNRRESYRIRGPWSKSAWVL